VQPERIAPELLVAEGIEAEDVAALLEPRERVVDDGAVGAREPILSLGGGDPVAEVKRPEQCEHEPESGDGPAYCAPVHGSLLVKRESAHAKRFPDAAGGVKTVRTR
jgi:hypothetical protein